jgi:hypothetical protein
MILPVLRNTLRQLLWLFINPNVQWHFHMCRDLEKISDVLFLWVMFFQLLFFDAPLSVACIQYGSANVERQEDQSSNESLSATVLPSSNILSSSSCHIHTETAGVSFSLSVHSSMFVLQYTPSTHQVLQGWVKFLDFRLRRWQNLVETSPCKCNSSF